MRRGLGAHGRAVPAADPAQPRGLDLARHVRRPGSGGDVRKTAEIRPERDLQRQPGSSAAGVAHREGLHPVGVAQPLHGEGRIGVEFTRHPHRTEEPGLRRRGEGALQGERFNAADPHLHPAQRTDAGPEEAVQSVAAQLTVGTGSGHRRGADAEDIGVRRCGQSAGRQRGAASTGDNGVGPPRGGPGATDRLGRQRGLDWPGRRHRTLLLSSGRAGPQATTTAGGLIEARARASTSRRIARLTGKTGAPARIHRPCVPLSVKPVAAAGPVATLRVNAAHGAQVTPRCSMDLPGGESRTSDRGLWSGPGSCEGTVWFRGAAPEALTRRQDTVPTWHRPYREVHRSASIGPRAPLGCRPWRRHLRKRASTRRTEH